VKKYFICNQMPILFEGTAKKYERFMANNEHLNGCDVSPADYSTAVAAGVEEQRSQDKRKAILKIADHDKQLQMIFDCLAKLQLNGIDISTEVSSFLGKRSQVK